MCRISETVRVFIVGHHFHEDGHPSGPVALINHFFVNRAPIEVSRSLLDGLLDIVLRHILRLGRRNRLAQARIALHISAAETGREGYLLRDLGKDFPPFRVSGALLMLD